MTARKPQPKVVRLLYRDSRYAGPGLLVEPDVWAEEIGPASIDAHVLQLARGAVEHHTAAWLVYFLTGELVGLWKPATTVEALGLDQSTDYRRRRLWQCEGMALVEAARLTEVVADAASVVVTDYRVEGARIMRRSSASCERARTWCEAYERKQGGRNVRPDMPLPRAAVEAAYEVTAPPVEPHDDVLQFYREAFVTYVGQEVGG